jgi:hypothetical protein
MIRGLAAALLLAGCATSRPEHPPVASAQIPTAEESQSSRAYAELRRLYDDFHDADVQATAPDCPRIAQLRDNICALATRICALTPQLPADSLARMYCADGTIRCAKAAEQAQARGCPKK